MNETWVTTIHQKWSSKRNNELLKENFLQKRPKKFCPPKKWFFGMPKALFFEKTFLTWNHTCITIGYLNKNYRFLGWNFLDTCDFGYKIFLKHAMITMPIKFNRRSRINTKLINSSPSDESVMFWFTSSSPIPLFWCL